LAPWETSTTLRKVFLIRNHRKRKGIIDFSICYRGPTPGLKKIKTESIQKFALLGTRFTMEEDFYKGRMVYKYGLEAIIPSAAQMEIG
jgi:hypothetical protein